MGVPLTSPPVQIATTRREDDDAGGRAGEKKIWVHKGGTLRVVVPSSRRVQGCPSANRLCEAPDGR